MYHVTVELAYQNTVPLCLFVAVFVITAADPRESSYACYYDDQRQTFLGDVFSVMWMQDSEKV
jgi:legumain